MPENGLKEIVRAFWANRAEEFDSEPDHVLHSSAQHQAWLTLLGRFADRLPSQILDVGCGTGFLAFLYAEMDHEVTGIDLSPEMIEVARAKAEQRGVAATFAVGDAERIEYPDTSFDLLIARHLLWTLPDPGRAVAEWLRVLRPHGRLVLIEGHWGVGELSGEYAQIHTHLPFFGGAMGEKVAAFLRASGVQEVQTEPLMTPELWHEPPKYPRYLVSGRKPAQS